MHLRLISGILLGLALLGAACVHEDARSLILKHYATGETITGTINFTTRAASITLPTGEILKGELSETIHGQAHAELKDGQGRLTLQLLIGLNAAGEVFGEARTTDGRHYRIQL